MRFPNIYTRLKGKLIASEEFLAQTIIDAFSPTVCVLNKAGEILLVNLAWRNYYDENFAPPLENSYFVGDNYFQVCAQSQSESSDADEADQLVIGSLQVIRGELDEFSMQYPCHSPTKKLWFNVRVTRFQGGSEHLMLSHENITEYKLTEEKLNLSAKVFSHAREGIMIADSAGIIIDVNETFTNITGYSREEAIGQNPRFLKSDRQSTDFYVGMWNEITTNGYWAGEAWNRRKNGEIYAEMETISSVCKISLPYSPTSPA